MKKNNKSILAACCGVLFFLGACGGSSEPASPPAADAGANTVEPNEAPAEDMPAQTTAGLTAERYETSFLSDITYDNEDIAYSRELFTAWQSDIAGANPDAAGQYRMAEVVWDFFSDEDFCLGNTFYGEEDYENAIKSYALAIETTPMHLPAINNMALCFMELGMHWQAAELLFTAHFMTMSHELDHEPVKADIILNYMAALYLCGLEDYALALGTAAVEKLDDMMLAQGAFSEEDYAWLYYNAYWVLDRGDDNTLARLEQLQELYDYDLDYGDLKSFYVQRNEGE